MGTQQILLIVLSVIIVGAAIAVGIQMFNSQAYSANKAAIAAEAQSIATQVVQYYKTPESQGGAGRVNTKMTPELIGKYIGWGGDSFTSDNGTFTLAAVGGTEPTVIIVTGDGTEIRDKKWRPQVVTTYTLATEEIVATLDDVDVTPPAGGE